jgi:hypothetical protein
MVERTSVLPEQEDQFTSFLRDVYSSTPEEDAQFQRFASGENAPQLPTAPGNLQEVFSAGIESGVQGLAADLEYFKALGNTLMGDEQAAALNIQEARLREEFAAAPVEGLDTFEQFLDQPTFGGFIEQATKSFGQVLPSAALSIAGAGTGAITAAVGRGVLNQVNKQVAKRIIKDSVERTANGVADPVEQQIAELAYGSLRTAAKRGAIGGAFAAEYAPMSGSNLSEALEAGQPLDQANALRAAAIGIPQAAIGVGSEYALLKLIGEQATKRAAVEGGVFANFAKRLGTGALQGGAIEATTEVAQEGISVVNRADLDPLFTAEDAKMRLAEAAFAGFFGGAAPGGAGGAIGGTLDAVSSMKPGQGALTTIGNVVEKAKELLDTARGQRVDQQINNEQFGDVASGLTTPESEGDIDAQLRAMADSTSGKKSVWIAGVGPRFDAPRNRVKTAFVDGVKAYSSFIPGRGTIISTDEDIVREVIAAGASDKALQIALGYSAVKDYSAPGDIVVQALDRNGRVISEEVTSPEGVSAAFEAARNLMPEGGSIQQTTVEKALEDRKRRFESEQRVEVRDIDLSDEQTDETDADQVEMFGQGVQAVEGQRTVVRAYGRKTDPNRVFDNTQSARASYDAVFGETNWANPRFASMTEAMLNAAVNEQRSNPDSAVSIEDTPDGGYQIVRDDFGDLFRSIDTAGNEVRLNLPEFLRSAIQRARRSKYAQNSRVTIVGPDGKKSAVNLVDLTAAGQRLLEGREGSGFQLRQDPRTGATYVSPEAAARAGLLEVLGDLAVEGYDVQIDGQSLFPGFQLTPDRNQAAAGRIPARLGNVTAAVIGGRQRSLNDLLNPVQEPVMTAEERQAALAAEPLGPPRDDVSDGRTETERMIESSVTGGELLTPMNIDTPRSAIDLRAGRAPTTVSPLAERRSAQERISNAINSMVGDIVRDLFDSLKFVDPPHIFTFAELTAMSDDQLLQLFGGALNPVREAIASMQNSSTKMGMHISGQFGKIIILRESGNVLQDALVIAHEIGHSLYKEERNKALENSAIRKRLFRAYQSSPSFKDLKDKYGFDLGFEEWFSDQVALWANKRYRSRQKADSLIKKFFKDFQARLESLWKQTSESFRKRFGGRLGAVNEDFETFMDAVLESRKSQVKENGLSFTERAFVYELNDLNIANGGAARAAHWQSKISQLKKSPYVKPILRLVSTADGILRMYAGNEIADMFYIRAQDPTGKGRLGFVPQSARTFDLYKNRLDTELGSFDDPALDAEFDKAASDTPTAQLTGKALAIRQFLEDFYSEYVSPSKTKIGFQRDYFPRLLDLVAIYNDSQAFIDLILQADPSADRAKITRRVQKLVDLQQSITNGANVEGNPLDPAASVNEALELTKNLTRQQLRDNGFLLPPKQAFSEYVRKVIKRVEFDRATKDDQGNDRLKPLLDALAPEDREQALQVINTYMGYRAPLSPFWRKLNSWGQFIQFVTILPFAAISSVTDLAGPIIASKEFGDLTTGMKEVVATIKNREEAKQLARDIGVVTPEAVANAWITDADADYMDPTARKWSDTWFSMTGLNWFTRFTREFATGMGVQFITKHARNEFNNPRSDRYLEELGLTRADVTSWLNSGRKLSTPEGKKVTQALQRFVESSTLRPNAAERPVWASDPHFALIWQLKGYFYSYGKVILGGMFSEAKTRLREQNIGTPWQRVGSAAGLLALTAVATMPLAMLGMELREYAKFGLAAFLPFVEADQKYFRTDRMDWSEYLGTAFERSNFSGPFGLATSASAAANFGDSPLATLLGPTTETIDTAMTNGWRIDRTLKDRLLPIYNQL